MHENVPLKQYRLQNTVRWKRNHIKYIWGREQVGKYIKPSWLYSGNCSLPQVACWLIWQGHRLPTLIQYYPSSRAPWTWQKEVSKVKPSYYMPHCSGPTTSPSNCPLTAAKHGPCQRMLKGHRHWHHLHLRVSRKPINDVWFMYVHFDSIVMLNPQKALLKETALHEG